MLDIIIEEEKVFPIFVNNELTDKRVELLKEIKLKEEIERNAIFSWDIEEIKERVLRIQKEGKARYITGEKLKELALALISEKKQESLTYEIPLLDTVTRGIRKGQYVIIAGRPSVGKSALLQFIGVKNAEKGKRVLFVSAEMSEELIIERLLSTYQPESIPEGFNVLVASSISTIEKEIEKRKGELDLILVDYLQLLRPARRINDLYERVTEVSSEIKRLTTRFNLPFVCASQFSRQADGKQPRLSDLRESGALEQDADIVISLWINKEDNDLNLSDNVRIIRIDLLKNRQGGTFVNSDTKEYKIAFNVKSFTFHTVDENTT